MLDTFIPPEIQTRIKELQTNLTGWQKNPRIGAILSQTVLKGGKRIRPMITFLTGDLFDIPSHKIAPFCEAVELVHASTLAHDDVIDNASTRRGQPSINTVTSNKKAVLAGDYLLAHVVGKISQIGNNQIVNELANVIGDLAEGEWLQMENASKTNLCFADIEQVALKKTGSVLRWCTLIPAIVSNQGQDIQNLSRLFGESLGIAFQISDDILDFKRKDGSQFADLKSSVVSSVIFEIHSSRSSCGKTIDMTSLTATSFLPCEISEALKRCQKILDRKILEAKQYLAQLGAVCGPNPSPASKQALSCLDILANYLSVRT